MATRSNTCPRCNHGYGSATHAKKCRGLAGPSLRAWRGRRNASRRNNRSLAKATRFAFAAAAVAGSASFYEDIAKSKTEPQPDNPR